MKNNNSKNFDKKEFVNKKNAKNLIWIDLEMTGLYPEENYIIEIATIATDKDLNILAEGPCFAIYQSSEVLDKMDDWNTRQHTHSGLVERVQNSSVDAQEAQEKTLDFVCQFVPPNTSPMCGNSICLDRQFLMRYMPNLAQFFHYRHIDVSTIKELVKRWKPRAKKDFQKKPAHLALSDIYDSIDELKHYRTHFINI